MIYTTTITSKGQITLPAPIRKKLGVKTGQKISIQEDKGKYLIEPIPDFFSLMGSLKTNIKWNKKKAYKAVGEMLAKRHQLT